MSEDLIQGELNGTLIAIVCEQRDKVVNIRQHVVWYTVITQTHCRNTVYYAVLCHLLAKYSYKINVYSVRLSFF